MNIHHEQDILQRNAKLEKELVAKNRELEIEAALERVRSRTNGMHRSENLHDVITEVNDQLRQLGFRFDGTDFLTDYSGKGYNIWVANFPTPVYVPAIDHKIFDLLKEVMKRGDDFFTFTLTTEEKNIHFQNIFENTIAKNSPEELKQHVYNAEGMATSCVVLKNIILSVTNFASIPYSDSENEILKRFAKVFEQSYTRFLDLQKAEAQAREAKIETALEKVRGRAMAMHKSDELLEAGALLYSELSKLGIEKLTSGYMLIDKDEKMGWNYGVNPANGQIIPKPVGVPLTETKEIRSILESWKKQEPVHVLQLDPGETIMHQSYMADHTINFPVSKEKLLSITPERLVIHAFNFKQGYLIIVRGEVLSAEQQEMVVRFAKVFEMTYRRFLDLQKAEAQAREAQIELSLERVRARTMAMHKSDELVDTSVVLFQELKTLGVKAIRTGVAIIDDATETMELWSSQLIEQKQNKVLGVVPMRVHPFFTNLLHAWKRKDQNFSYEMQGDEVKAYYLTMSSFLSYPQQQTYNLREIFNPFFFSEGSLTVVSSEPLSDEERSIMQRFARVFGLLYRRFLDLQKAEAQAREAQIELGLERVRARAMAMQKSDELKELIGTVYNELTKLDLALDRCLIWVMNSEDLSSRLWMANAESQPVNFYIPHHDNPPYLAFVKAWKGRNTKWQYDLHGQVKKEWDEYVFSKTEMKHLPDPVKKNMQATDKVLLAGSFHNFGCLQTAGPEPLKEEQFDILNRFAKVFDLTYTRFNDLQKAEAQSRESQIELGLERVRARAMAMQKSDELSELVDTVFKELTKLDFALTWCIINIIDEPSLSNTVWAASPDINKAPESYHMLFEDYPFHHVMMKGWKERQTKCVYTLEGNEKKVYDEYLFRETEFKRTPEAAQAASRAMEKYVVSFLFSNFGGLQTVGDVPLSDANLDILSRFGKVFDLTYTRFNDLKQAEAQARESQIQLALERVRARTMAMQHSDELKDAAALLFQQAKALGVPAYSCGYNIWEKNEKAFTSWMSTQDGSDFNAVQNIPLTEDANFIRFAESRENGEQFFVLELRGERMQEHYEYLKTIPAFKAYFDYAISVGFDLPETQIHHLANFSQGNLLFITLEPCSEFHDVFKRFAAVFEQTYTRFLDLQKAEAQARDSQIELALERVRARTMAMQKSDELREAVLVIYEQLQQLNFNSKACNIIIIDKESGSAKYWVSGFSQEIFPESYTVPYFDHPYQDALLKPWKQGDKYVVYEYTGKMKQSFDEIFFTQTEFRNVPEDAKKVMIGLESVKLSTAFISYGALQALGAEPLSEENANILQRFAKVFEQTYTRFLDLQKAEAQAREAQIETALERVRSRTMAMHRSEEIADILGKMFEELKRLDMVLVRVLIWIFNHEEKYISWWSANAEVESTANSYRVDYNEHPVFLTYLEAWQKKVPLKLYTLSGAEKDSWQDHLFKNTGLSKLPEMVQKGMRSEGTIFTTGVISDYGLLMSGSLESLSDENTDIIQRFGRVFQQSYTRYIDVQKAEAQTRESQIQLAMERVRARTMAMQKSDELPKAANLLFLQVQSLGMPAWSAGYCIWDDDKQAISLSMSSEGILQPTLRMPLTEDPSLKHFREAYEKGQSFFVEEVGGDALKEHYAYLRTLPGVKETLDDIERAGFPVPTLQIFHLAYFSQGFLLFITYEPVSESHDIFKRFAKVFEQTYTRFLDLQKAEAQAREAQIEASLERIRSRTMGMQKSNELKDVATLLNKELIHLGITNFASCGYIEIEEKNNRQHSWLTNPDGVSLEHFFLPLTGEQIFDERYDAWKRKDVVFKQVVHAKELKKHLDFAYSGFGSPESENIGRNFFPDPTIFYSCNFSYGYLSLITGVMLDQTEELLLARFTRVFEQTYSRFLDLQKAEAQARESQIQLALERVRARTMAMQKSDELMETAVVLFDQLKQLGENIERTIIGVVNEEEHVVDVWATRPGGSQMDKMQKFPIDEPILMQKVYAAWRQQKKSIVIDLRGEELESYFQFLKSRGPRLKRESFGERRVENFAFFSKGMLGIISEDPNTPANVGLHERFAAVFDQTYTRFLDLQKSEAQAREAKVEAALERVRSRSMGMQRSDELKEVIQVVYEQFVHLNIHVEHTGFVMDYKARDDYDIWIADQLGVPSHVTIPYFDCVYYNRFNEAKKKGEDFFVTNLDFEEKNRFYQKIIEYVPGLPEETKEFLFSIPGLAASTVLLENIGLYIENFSGIPYTDEENKTLMRFGKVFQQTYTRFLDLQKAEAQARESKIEAALEKVRSRTMGMQRSEELGDVATVLFKEMNQLVENLWTCGFVLCERDRAEDEWWLSTETGFIPAFYLPNTGDATHENIYDGWKNGESYHTEQLEGEALKEHYEWLYNIPAAKKIFDEMIAGGFSLPTWQKLHCAYFSKGYLCIITQVLCKEEQVFKRFAQVFDLTYTRFLDLQKAEAQAREAKIEAALERVRSRSMAMHKSDELLEVINVVSEQLQQLKIKFGFVSFGFIGPDLDFDFWLASPGFALPERIHAPYIDNPIPNTVIEAQKKGLNFFTNIFSGEDNNQWLRLLIEDNKASRILETTKDLLLNSPGFARSAVILKNINIFIGNYVPKSYTNEENEIIRRFANVFEQSYTRFLDLQKAEAQAREAKIETALEKVRASTMAMQHSDHLSETAFVLFKQFKELGEAPERIFIATFDEEQQGIIDIWGTNQGGNQLNKLFKVSADEPTVISKIIAAWKEKKRSVVIDLSGEELKQYIRFLRSTGMPVVEGIMEERRVQTIGCFSKGVIGVTTPEPQSAESVQLLERFAGVFDLTYTRFLDLQQAEAQAREAKIEAALERVRSRTMAMQRSDELAEAATVLFQQVKALGVPQWTCGFGIFEIDDKEFTWYPGSADGDILPPVKIPLTEHPVFISFNESRKRGDDLFVYEKEGEFQAGHYRYMQSLPGVGEMLQKMLDAGLTFPTFQIDHVANFSHGNLVFITYEPFPQMHDVFKRFAKVFDQTYTRFLDLQKSEAQAREAIKQASVDRVRAEIASMRTTNDLERIQPLVWNELTTLGVPFTRCGVFIMDEEHEQVDTFLSTPDGKSIASFTSNYSDVSVISEALPYWRKKEIYKAHWDEATFLAQAQTLLSQGNITSTETYLTEHRPKDLYLHLLPFLQGILYVGNETPLKDDELQLVQNLADAFSIAYARYEDFNRLELAKEQIENTLVDLKQTQAQLVQSEKMASLGELTAGIAHEIQNPLNFVNNFSEVNTELIAEMKDEIEKGNIEEVKAIANDIADNEQKINHHGKRADAIVKGMLQHSRSSSGVKEPSDINVLADEYLRLAYHGLRAKDKSFNATMKTDYDETIGKINIVPQEVGRSVLNLITNAFYAVSEKKKQNAEGYEPTVTVTTKRINGKVEIRVADNGNGIPQKVLDKIFQPFFTTKPTGQGTGLGLSLSYDIIKAHNGELKVNTNEGEGSEFIIFLPANN